MGIKGFQLKGELLEKSAKFDDLREKIKKLSEEKDKLRDYIMEHLKTNKIEKTKSQLYSVSLTLVKQEKVSTKKLKEELEARNMEDIYNSCLYKSEYYRLVIKKRKHGGNIF